MPHRAARRPNPGPHTGRGLTHPDKDVTVFLLAFPVLLLVGLMLMERLEQPLRAEEIGHQLESFMAAADAPATLER